MRPQVACRPIVVQLALSDPFAFANVAAFGEILSLEHDDRAARYATAEWRAQGPHRDAGGVGRHPRLRRRVGVRRPPGARRAGHRGRPGPGPRRERHRRDGRAGGGRRSPDPLHHRHDQRQRGRDRRAAAATTTSCSGCPTPARTPASSATPTTPPTCCSTGGASGRRSAWRRRCGASPASPPRSTASPTGVASPRAWRPTSSCSTPPPWAPRGPRRIDDFPAGADRLVADSTGIAHVWVGGVRTRHDGEQLTGVGAGTLLRGGTA